MIQIIIHAFIDNKVNQAVVEVAYATQQAETIQDKLKELQEQFPQDYLAIYDLPLDRDLTQLAHYPSVAIEKEDFQ
ncbi:phosphoribosylaminoimidazole carboxylase [Streptococcus loxodontisalivarius]|uniref:Phosphoribosylaminoimidazole carboxylase n=1 Tax=Streptococcus loxodontisalivarius TaxID=1349415 RepID=A0ABS2PTV9_9STRE|nr:phosphoribosylaminoimidazole carboxylase [Streptococcus loxodontisalivarius]MBM7643472.1 hypothetical protein [Streptococcus loxodontisalivarius]